LATAQRARHAGGDLGLAALEPADIGGGDVHGDVDGAAALRAHPKHSPWAEGILTRRPLSLAAESTTQVREPIPQLLERLDEAGVRYLHVTSKGALSKYGARESGRSLRVRRQPDWRAKQLYARYRETTVLERVYVAREEVERAGRWLEELRNRPWI